MANDPKWYLDIGRSLKVQVEIIDVKRVSGDPHRYKIRPIAGEGAAWIDAKKLIIKEESHDR